MSSSAARVAWAKRNPDKVREIKRRFRERHRERLASAAAAKFQADKGKHYDQVKRWAEANPELVKGQRLRAALRSKQRKLGRELRFHYNITYEQYERIANAQGNVCAICGQANDTKRSKRLFVDHNHTTGRLRALLCHACNAGLGYFKEDPALFARAAAYLSLFEGDPAHDQWDDDVLSLLPLIAGSQ
jgi:hypothetical protein